MQEPRIAYAWEGEVAGLKAEIERLRAALTDIRGLSIHDPDDPLPTIFSIAKKALNEQQMEKK